MPYLIIIYQYHDIILDPIKKTVLAMEKAD